MMLLGFAGTTLSLEIKASIDGRLTNVNQF
jgi:hypothetical protein